MHVLVLYGMHLHFARFAIYGVSPVHDSFVTLELRFCDGRCVGLRTCQRGKGRLGHGRLLGIHSIGWTESTGAADDRQKALNYFSDFIHIKHMVSKIAAK